MQGSSTHGSIKSLRPGLSQRLSAIHGNIGVSQEILGGFALWGIKCNANAGGCESFMAIDLKRTPQAIMDSFRDCCRLAWVLQVIDQDDEFITAHSRHGVFRTHTLLQNVAYFDQ